VEFDVITVRSFALLVVLVWAALVWIIEVDSDTFGDAVVDDTLVAAVECPVVVGSDVGDAGIRPGVAAGWSWLGGASLDIDNPIGITVIILIGRLLGVVGEDWSISAGACVKGRWDTSVVFIISPILPQKPSKEDTDEYMAGAAVFANRLHASTALSKVVGSQTPFVA
jgi:hypothetical protein